MVDCERRKDVNAQMTLRTAPSRRDLSFGDFDRVEDFPRSIKKQFAIGGQREAACRADEKAGAEARLKARN
jgi:hypothetical protein